MSAKNLHACLGEEEGSKKNYVGTFQNTFQRTKWNFFCQKQIEIIGFETFKDQLSKQYIHLEEIIMYFGV